MKHFSMTRLLSKSHKKVLKSSPDLIHNQVNLSGCELLALSRLPSYSYFS